MLKKIYLPVPSYSSIERLQPDLICTRHFFTIPAFSEQFGKLRIFSDQYLYIGKGALKVASCFQFRCDGILLQFKSQKYDSR